MLAIPQLLKYRAALQAAGKPLLARTVTHCINIIKKEQKSLAQSNVSK
jgi:hypothetical protein